MSVDSSTVRPAGQVQAAPAAGWAPSEDVSLPLTVIESGARRPLLDLRELWRYRDLLYFLTWRDIAVRYKQTILGMLWAVLQPLLSMIVFSIFFGRLAGLDRATGGIPYPAFVYAGLLPWTLFSQSVARSSESVVGSSALITKVYFPRLYIPMAAVGACLVDFAIASAVLLGIMFWYGIAPTTGAALAPALLALTAAAGLGVGALVSALNVAYRDFRHVVPFMLQLWMLATPAIYARDILPGNWHWLTSLNPLNGLINGWRSCLLGGTQAWEELLVSAAAVLLAFAVGVAHFRRTERQFADII